MPQVDAPPLGSGGVAEDGGDHLICVWALLAARLADG
jgi:hypothetical protein